MPVLHQMHVSGNCYKVRLAARQLDVDLKLADYELLDGTTRQPEFLAKNPNGRVPMLELDDGRFLPESGAILWYLAEGTPLVPAIVGAAPKRCNGCSSSSTVTSRTLRSRASGSRSHRPQSSRKSDTWCRNGTPRATRRSA